MRAVVGTLGNGSCAGLVFGGHYARMGDFVKFKCLPSFLTAVLAVSSKTIYVTLKFTLEQAMKAQRGSRGIVLLFPSPRR